MTMNPISLARRFALLAAPVVILTGCNEEEATPEQPPRQVSSSTFHYPEELWENRVEGETTLRIFVTDDGTVDSARVDETSGYEEFDSAAVRGAYDLRFEPARRGDEPISVWVLLPVRFDLPNGEEEATP